MESTTEILDFWAEWCAPCKAYAPTVDSLPYPVTKINVDKEPDLAAHYGVMSLPTLIAIKNGVPSQPLVGLRPRDKVMAWLGEA